MKKNEPKGEARISVRRLLGWGILGQMAFVISQFLLLTVLARFAQVEDVGRFGLTTAVVTPVYWFFNLGMRENQSTDTRSVFRFREFLALRLMGTGFAYLLIVAIAFLAMPSEIRSVMLVFGAAKGLESVSLLYYGLFQKAERIQYVARSLILRGFGGTFAFAIVIWLTGGTAEAYSALFLAWLLVLILVDALPARKLAQNLGDDGEIRQGKLRELAMTSLPLGISGLLTALQTSTPRFVIGSLLGVAALGQFTVVAYALQASQQIVTAISQSISARLAHQIVNGNRHALFTLLRKLLVGLGGVGVIFAMISLVFGNWILTGLFGNDYEGLATLLAMIVIAAMAAASVNILQAALIASRRFSLQSWLRLFSLTLTAVATLVGTLVGGLEGTVIGLVIASFSHAIVLIWLLRRIV